jgi:DNA polymerase-3 subunit gamma/tau
MASLLQQMAVQQAVPGALDADDPDAPAVERLAAALPADETQLLYSIVVHGRAELALAPDEYSGLVMVLLRLLAFRPAGAGSAERPAPRSTPAPAPAPARNPVAAQPAVLAGAPVLRVPAPPVQRAPVQRPSVARSPEPPPWVDAPDEAEGDAPPATSRAAAAVAPARGPLPEPMAGATVAPVVTTPLGDRWAVRVRELCESGAIGALVRELAMQAQCVAFDESASPARFTLRVERETLRSAANGDKLQAALTQALGRPVQLQLEAGVAEDSPARRDAAERARRQAEAEQIIHDDPLVQALMAQYKTARIVPGSVKPH